MLGILTGLKSEAVIAKRLFPGAVVACAASDADQACKKAQILIDLGADHLLSFGIAGALAPELTPGNLVIANEVIFGDGKLISADNKLSNALLRIVPTARLGRIFGANQVIGHPGEKHHLHQRLQALAVDTESGALATLAMNANLPFAVLRAIADSATQNLPTFAQKCIGADGGIAIGPVLREIVLKPHRWKAAHIMGRDSRAAHNALASLLSGFAGRSLMA